MLRKLWERNLSVIPVEGKKAFLSNWTRYCTELPTEAEIDLWESMYQLPKYGIGLCCGPASGITGIDWDTESPDIKILIPPSPVVRFGAKGGLSLYRYNPNIVNTKQDRDNLGPNKNKKYEGVEVFGSGKQFVLPPSIHPDTRQQYRWITPDTLENFNVSDLPEITQEEIDILMSYIRKFPKTDNGKNLNEAWSNSASSRNERLTQVICAMMCQDSTKKDEEFAEEIYKLDLKEYSNPYFSDPTRQHNKKARGDAKLAALYFVREHRERLIKKGLTSRMETIVVKDFTVVKKAPNPFPESDGLIHAIKSAIMRCSRSGGQDELATGAAIAICSTLAANRFHIEGRPAITHQYIMCVARTGKGKGAAVKIANALFYSDELKKYNLSGLSNYSSNAAFVEHLPTQRQRLDLIDEFGTILKGIGGNNDLKKEMEGFLCSIYSDFHFKGHNTKTNNKQGACVYPAVTIFANIQRTTLVNLATKSMLETGFLTRFMNFSAKEDTDINPNYLDAIDVTDIARECARIFPYYPMETVNTDCSITTDIGSIEPRREALTIGNNVIKHRNAMDRLFYEKERELFKYEKFVEASLHTRQFEMIERLAITNAVSCDRREITCDDYDYAMRIVSTCYEHSSDYYRLIGSENREDRDLQRVFQIIKKHGKIARKDLMPRSHLLRANLDRVLTTLIEMEHIGLVQQENGSKKVVYAALI